MNFGRACDPSTSREPNRAKRGPTSTGCASQLVVSVRLG